MARAPSESRIPIFRSTPGNSSATLPRPTMLVPPSSGGSPVMSAPSSPVNQMGSVSTMDVGQRVSVGGVVTGVLRFHGTTHLEPIGSIWCGVELDTPDGLNDGCVRGVRYFRCRPNYGILAPEHKVRLVVPPPTRSKKSSLPHSSIKRRVPPDRSSSRENIVVSPASSYSGRSRDKTDSGSGSSQDEITPPVEEQPNRSETPHQPRSATATPTPGCSVPVWDSWTHKHSTLEGDGAPIEENTLEEIDIVKEMTIVSPTSSEGRSISQRLRAGSLVLPLVPDSPLAGSSQHALPPALGSKQSSFELDDSLGILTPDQMLTDFTVTSAGAGSEDDERPGSAELGGMMHEDVPPSPPPLLDDTLVPPATPPALPSVSIPPEPEDHSEQFSDMSSAADTTSKGAACSSSQQQSTSSSIVQQSCSSSVACGPAPTAGTTSLAPACSFITSVTSITSLDTGYQGDGEWSRPASRADNSPGVPPPPPPPGVLAVDVHKLKFDVMTDSDFFSDPGAAGTESDAELEAAGMTAGDRRARVIDGTLYGTSPASSVAGPLPAAPAHLMTSSAATIEEMDSSGIFSDMERRPDTFESFTMPTSQPVVAESVPVDSVPSTSDSGVMEVQVSEVISTTDEIILPKSAGHSPANNKEEKVTKKHKMPKRNVTSKIKALIEASPVTKPDENQENRRPVRKGGKWDAVMNKIAQNQAEEKARPKLKEVKSRVFSSIAAASPASPQSPKTSSRNSAGSTRSNTSRPSSARTRRENAAAAKTKPRRNRLRGAESSASLQRVVGGDEEEEEEGPSPNSSHCSSISDVSQEPCSSKPSLPRSTKKRAAALDGVAVAHLARSGSPLSDVSTNSAATPQPPGSRTPSHNNNNALVHLRSTNSPAERGTKAPNSGVSNVQQRNQRNSFLSSSTPPSRRGVVPGTAQKTQQDKQSAASSPTVAQTSEMKTPIPLRKQQQQQQQTSGPPRLSQKPTPLRDHNRLSGTRQPLHNSSLDAGKTEVSSVTSTTSTTKSLPATLSPHLLNELKHASAGCEAMAVLVQYLVHSLDAFSAPRLKREASTMREQWARTKLELEEAQASYRHLQETLSDEVAAHERREEAQRIEHEEAVATLTRQHMAAVEVMLSERQALEQRLLAELEVKSAEGAAREATLAEVLHELAEARAQNARRVEESAHREAELGEQLAKVSAELAESKASSQKFWNTVNKDKDARLQLSIDQCQTLQKEVDSLQAVLELKGAELQTLRKTCATAQESAERVPALEIALSAARTKIEDIQSQLDVKINIERQLKDENKALNELNMIESQNNRRLSQAKEELQWKLKQSSEVFNKLTSINSPTLSLNSSVLFPISPLLARRSTPNGNCSYNNNSHRLSPGLDDDLPDSPRVKVMSEKTDSIAWTLDMNETVDALVEKVHSNQRQRQDRSSPGRCLPKKSASTSAILSDQRGKLAGRKSRVTRGLVTSTPTAESRCRSRSVSTDSESLELESKSCSSQPERRENGTGEAKVDCLNLASQSNSSQQPVSPSTMLTLPFKIQLQPQEGAGEAMISEEISDDAQSDCEANQAVGVCSGRSSESSSLVMANGAQLDIDDDEEEDDEDEVQPVINGSRLVCPAQPLRTSPTLDSASQLGPTDNTAMDLSWSEDFELLTSECEG